METCSAQNNATTTLNQTPLHIQRLLDTKPCPVKFPTFAGLAEEDFIVFKNRFTTAAQARGFPRVYQVDKLRDTLTGKALAYLPKEGIKDIDALRRVVVHVVQERPSMTMTTSWNEIPQQKRNWER